MILKRSDSTVRRLILICIGILSLASFSCRNKSVPAEKPEILYEVSFEKPGDRLMHVVLECRIPGSDTVFFEMPEWMPGYYQIMNYSDKVSNFAATGSRGIILQVIKKDDNTWSVIPGKDRTFRISYDVLSDRRFVACNFVDTVHAYIIPPATFMYLRGHADLPVRVRINPYEGWSDIATGLEAQAGKEGEFTAPDFDILYDCPILTGDLDELPPFTVNGITHRFITWYRAFKQHYYQFYWQGVRQA